MKTVYVLHGSESSKNEKFLVVKGKGVIRFRRIDSDEVIEYLEKAKGMAETWDSIKILFDVKERMKDIYAIEKDYLDKHPDSGYLTEILTLSDFPDYIDYLPHGAIPRKIEVMGYMPQDIPRPYPYIVISKEEYLTFLNRATALAVHAIRKEMMSI